jgi:hypothetical protein
LSVFARVAVPEAAAYLDYFAPTGKYQIWSPGQIPAVKPVPASRAEDELPDDDRILRDLC